MFYASLYFFGRYRPVHVQAETAAGALAGLYALVSDEAPEPVRERLKQLWCLYLENSKRERPYSGFSTEHGMVGALLRDGVRDPWLDSVTADMPPCEGITY